MGVSARLEDNFCWILKNSFSHSW